MSRESVAAETTSEHDVRRKAVWLFSLGSSIPMLYYEYMWSLFALHNRGAISFGGWFGTSMAIATPWIFCFACLSELKDAARKGKLDQDTCWRLSMSVGAVMMCIYLWFASDIQRLTSLGALK